MHQPFFRPTTYPPLFLPLPPASGVQADVALPNKHAPHNRSRYLVAGYHQYSAISIGPRVMVATFELLPVPRRNLRVKGNRSGRQRDRGHRLREVTNASRLRESQGCGSR